MTFPFDVDKVVENVPHDDEGIHQIQVALTGDSYRVLLRDLSRSVFRAKVAKRPIFAWLIRAGSEEVRGIDHLEAVTRVRSLLGQEPPSWLLTPEEATSLGHQLLEAAEEPVRCGCGRLIPQPSSLTHLTGCDLCHGKGD